MSKSYDLTPSEAKLYSAERRAFARGSYADVDDARKLLSLADTQAYANHVTESSWWNELLRDDHSAVTVKDGRGRRSAACVSYQEISVPVDLRRPWIILHELAHVATQRKTGWNTVPWHGSEFAQIYLALVQRFLGGTRPRSAPLRV